MGQGNIARSPLTLSLVHSVGVFGWLLFGWAASSQDLIGGAENPLCALFGDRIGVVSNSLI